MIQDKNVINTEEVLFSHASNRTLPKANSDYFLALEPCLGALSAMDLLHTLIRFHSNLMAYQCPKHETIKKSP